MKGTISLLCLIIILSLQSQHWVKLKLINKALKLNFFKVVLIFLYYSRTSPKENGVSTVGPKLTLLDQIR